MKWAEITSIILIVYGLFLIFQSCWSGWSIIQEGRALDILKIVGGIVLISWAIIFWVKGLK